MHTCPGMMRKKKAEKGAAAQKAEKTLYPTPAINQFEDDEQDEEEKQQRLLI